MQTKSNDMIASYNKTLYWSCFAIIECSCATYCMVYTSSFSFSLFLNLDTASRSTHKYYTRIKNNWVRNTNCVTVIDFMATEKIFVFFLIICFFHSFYSRNIDDITSFNNNNENIIFCAYWFISTKKLKILSTKPCMAAKIIK